MVSVWSRQMVCGRWYVGRWYVADGAGESAFFGGGWQRTGRRGASEDGTY